MPLGEKGLGLVGICPLMRSLTKNGHFNGFFKLDSER